jgi:hypothetical protein
MTIAYFIVYIVGHIDSKTLCSLNLIIRNLEWALLTSFHLCMSHVLLTKLVFWIYKYACQSSTTRNKTKGTI